MANLGRVPKIWHWNLPKVRAQSYPEPNALNPKPSYTRKPTPSPKPLNLNPTVHGSVKEALADAAMDEDQLERVPVLGYRVQGLGVQGSGFGV